MSFGKRLQRFTTSFKAGIEPWVPFFGVIGGVFGFLPLGFLTIVLGVASGLGPITVLITVPIALVVSVLIGCTIGVLMTTACALRDAYSNEEETSTSAIDEEGGCGNGVVAPLKPGTSTTYGTVATSLQKELPKLTLNDRYEAVQHYVNKDERQLQLERSFKDPVSFEIMENPVVLSTGQTVDESTALAILDPTKGSQCCPITNKPLDKVKPYTLNYSFRSVIISFIELLESRATEKSDLLPLTSAPGKEQITQTSAPGNGDPTSVVVEPAGPAFQCASPHNVSFSAS